MVNGVPEALVVDCWRFNPAKALKLLADPEYRTIIHFAQMETRWVGYDYGVRIENLADTCTASKLIYKRHGFIGEPLAEDLERIGADEKSAQRALDEGRDLPAAKGIRHALGIVAQRELGLELDKEQQNSWWDAARLTPAQQKYAGEDVLSLLDLWERSNPY